MNDREQSLRQTLGIPDDAQQVLILEQSAHCDWDWVATFPVYYGSGGGGHQAVRTTLQAALGLISEGFFTYVYCEVAYLQSFMNDPNVSASDKAALAAAAGSTFLFSSGGITSAENLTLHTESFIRNYLLGRQWLSQTFGVQASNQMWIPDDFGHDAQLPVLLQAMGFTGAGFERIPAQTFAPNTPCYGVTAASDAPSEYLPGSVGLDFNWRASDGSQVQGHWLSGGYCAGNTFGNWNGYGGGTIPTRNGTSGIETLIGQNTVPATPGVPYMFSPIDCDFTAPYTNLPQVIADWNKAPSVPGVYVCLASFDQYMQLVASSMTLNTVTSVPGTYPAYVPHPYYSGCYGSKPLLKQMHYATVRTLLFAEAMQLILQANGNSSDLAAIAEAWADVAPSTHHDYITGTSPNGASQCPTSVDVYNPEQVMLLQSALDAAGKVKDDVLSQIAALQPPAPQDKTGNPVAVVVFNPLAFDRRAVAHLATVPPGGPFESSTQDFQTFHGIQSDGKGGLLLLADVPALGYATVYLTTKMPTTFSPLSASSTGTNVVMHNDTISAVMDATGLFQLTDQKNGRSPNYLRGPVNVVTYIDGGNIYRFGMEIPCPSPVTFTLDTKNPPTDSSIMLVETGPMRARAVLTETLGADAYTVTFELYATDTAVRVTVEGAASSGHSVMACVPFNGSPASLTYGTTSHWDTQSPRDAFDWNPPSTTEVMTFEPTHEYVASLDASGTILGAIYHYATPGWAIDNSGNILGCLLRNTPGQQNAACGTDSDSHTVSFAVALPVGLQLPIEGATTSGSMLKAALDVNNPLEAVAVPAGSTAALQSSMSLASTSDARALLTVAKAGTLDSSQLILRLYQPTNELMPSIGISLDPTLAANYRGGGANLVAAPVTAIEEPSSANLNLSTDASSVTLDLPYAITTIALG
jgi:alpha-mannosidase